MATSLASPVRAQPFQPYVDVRALERDLHDRTPEWFHDHVRIEQALFDGAADATGGELAIDRTAAGNGYRLREPDAARYRVAGERHEPRRV
jgi:hypothetical protein